MSISQTIRSTRIAAIVGSSLLMHNHPTSLGKRERQGDYLPPGQGPPCTPAGEVPCYLSPGQGSPFSYLLQWFCTKESMPEPHSSFDERMHNASRAETVSP